MYGPNHLSGSRKRRCRISIPQRCLNTADPCNAHPRHRRGRAYRFAPSGAARFPGALRGGGRLPDGVLRQVPQAVELRPVERQGRRDPMYRPGRRGSSASPARREGGLSPRGSAGPVAEDAPKRVRAQQCPCDRASAAGGVGTSSARGFFLCVDLVGVWGGGDRPGGRAALAHLHVRAHEAPGRAHRAGLRARRTMARLHPAPLLRLRAPRAPR